MGLFVVRGPQLIVPASGYNNLLNWPSVANRPALVGNTLSWIGPLGGGPSTANDVLQSRVLTNSGAVSSSSNGQVIQGLKITSNGAIALNITHTGVTVKQCAIIGGAFIQSVGNDDTVMEDCYSDATGSSQSSGLIKFRVIRRCNVLKFENNITTSGTVLTNATIIDNWLHAAVGPDADLIELYSADTVLVQHNSFDGTDNTAGLLNAGLNMTDQDGTVINITVENNAYINLPHTQICDDGSKAGGTVTFSATNNGFFNPGGALRLNVASACSPNSGNFVMAAVDAISGALVNGGTGVI